MIVALAGLIGSGKSTFARRLASHLGTKVVSFGDYVRAKVHTDRMDAGNRFTLQDAGEAFARTPEDFVHGAFLHAGVRFGDPCILDGLRHVAIWKLITDSYPRPKSVLIFLEVSEIERQRRLLERGIDPQMANTLDNHRSERDVQYRLRQMADLCLNSELPSTDVVNSAIAFLLSKNAVNAWQIVG